VDGTYWACAGANAANDRSAKRDNDFILAYF
jgi:hypothetical protein